MERDIRNEIKERAKRVRELVAEFKGLALKLTPEAPLVVLYNDDVVLCGDELEYQALLSYATAINEEFQALKHACKFARF